MPSIFFTFIRVSAFPRPGACRLPRVDVAARQQLLRAANDLQDLKLEDVEVRFVALLPMRGESGSTMISLTYSRIA
jgi:hypothetical protein